jgi:hypothetical protein
MAAAPSSPTGSTTSFSDPWQQLLDQHPFLQDDVLEFRHLLEASAAELAAQRATDSDLQRLEQRTIRLDAAYRRRRPECAGRCRCRFSSDGCRVGAQCLVRSPAGAASCACCTNMSHAASGKWRSARHRSAIDEAASGHPRCDRRAPTRGRAAGRANPHPLCPATPQRRHARAAAATIAAPPELS